MPGTELSAMLPLLNSTLSKFIKNKHWMAQKLQSHPVIEKFILTSQKGVMDAHRLEWTPVLSDNDGSFRGVNYHEAWAAKEGPSFVRASVDAIKYEGKGIVFDRRELSQNKSTGQIVNLMNVKMDQHFSYIFRHLEADMCARPVSASDTTHMLGLPAWARPSMSAAGAFVADTTGGFNGTYIRRQDATVTSTLAGIDAANLIYEYWRNWVATHGGAMNYALCEAIRRANNYTSFQAFPRKIGETVMGMVSIFMPQAFHESYLSLINNGPDDRRTGGKTADIFPFSGGTLGGVNILRTPQLDLDATLPIYGVRHEGFYFAHDPSFFFKKGEFREMPNAHNSIYAPIDLVGNTVCLQPRDSIWTIHGSF